MHTIWTTILNDNVTINFRNQTRYLFFLALNIALYSKCIHNLTSTQRKIKLHMHRYTTSAIRI